MNNAEFSPESLIGSEIPNCSFKIGDYVCVKDGTKDPEIADYDIGGFTGRIFGSWEDDDGKVVLQIKTDPSTVAKMDPKHVQQLKDEDFQIDVLFLNDHEVEPLASPSETVDITEEIREIAEGEAEDAEVSKRLEAIEAVMADADPENIESVFFAWLRYLKKRVKTPLDGIIDNTDAQPGEPETLNVRIKSIHRVDGEVGILAKTRFPEGDGEYPVLGIFFPESETSESIEAIRDYQFWWSMVLKSQEDHDGADEDDDDNPYDGDADDEDFDDVADVDGADDDSIEVPFKKQHKA